MDLDLLSTLKVQGPLVTALIVIIIYFYRREKRGEKAIADAVKKCEEREKLLHEKVDAHDRRFTEHVRDQHSETMSLAHTCARALEINASAFKRLSENETDKFRAIQPTHASDHG